ncbi:putative dissimilatory sulfite reductase B (dsrB), partial [marine sediment metagenome]
VINEERCMFCSNCFTVCPALPIADPEGDGLAVFVPPFPYFARQLLEFGIGWFHLH